MTAEEEDNHSSKVKFEHIDPEEEEDRTNRGYEHRKDLVRGIKFQKENDEMIKVAQLECGLDWLRDESMSLEKIQTQDFGTRTTIHGFLALYHKEISEEDEEDLGKLWEYFQKTPKEKEVLTPKLQEFLSFIAVLVGEGPQSSLDSSGHHASYADM